MQNERQDSANWSRSRDSVSGLSNGCCAQDADLAANRVPRNATFPLISRFTKSPSTCRRKRETHRTIIASGSREGLPN